MNLSTQCAAVRTVLVDIIEPPQKWALLSICWSETYNYNKQKMNIIWKIFIFI